MHILHVETGRHLYGGARQVLTLLTGLEARGVRNTLACPAGSAIATVAVEAGLPVITHEIGGDLDVAAVSFLLRTARELAPDLLHAHSRRGADFFGGLAAGLAGIPAVLTRRVDNPDTPLIGNLKYLAYDRVVAISEAVRVQLSVQGVPAEKLSVIHSAVDAGGCQPTWSRERFLAEFHLEPAERVVAVVAQFIPRKGHAALLDAWPLVRHQCPDVRLLLFGQGPLEAELKARSGFSGSVSFLGFRPDLKDYLGHVDLLVHPASAEGLGVSLLEAQAAGVPVVGFRAGGVAEAVADGVTGLLVPLGDGPALADAVVRLLDDPNLRQRFGAAARARVAREFTPGRMVDAYLALYRDLLHSTKAMPRP